MTLGVVLVTGGSEGCVRGADGRAAVWGTAKPFVRGIVMDGAAIFGAGDP
ncbi:MAG: hypothetical protein ACKO6E_09930 [Planctomycetota bacterium]